MKQRRELGRKGDLGVGDYHRLDEETLTSQLFLECVEGTAGGRQLDAEDAKVDVGLR